MSEYYKAPNGLEVFDLIHSLSLDFADGNIFKYVFRAGRKPGTVAAEDYKKALHYLELGVRAPIVAPRWKLIQQYSKAFELPKSIAGALVMYEADAAPLIEALREVAK